MHVGSASIALPFDPTRTLMLGGVKIAGAWGLRGVADGDVVLRAVAEAMLGAAGLGDLGDHVPDTDAAWQGVPAARVVAECVAKLAAQGLVPAHVDVTLLAERPDLRPHRAAMHARLVALLGLDPARVNVKVSEGLGPDSGVGAHAIVSAREVTG